MLGRTSPLVAAAALLGLIAAPACQDDTVSLDEIQRMAYLVRPAVVRVRAYATARFVPAPSTLSEIHDEIARRGLADPRASLPTTLEVETGAGGSGSGFVVHPDGIILTSGHVVSLIRDPAATQAELLRNGAVATLMTRYPVDTLRSLQRASALVPLIGELTASGSLREIRSFREVDLSNGDRAPFAILEFSPSLAERGDDVAVLHIERHDLPVLELGNSEAVHIQDPIWVIGYPAVASTSDEMIGGWLSQESDLEPTVSSGSISAIKRNIANVPVFQTDAPIYQGNSGGPAVNRRGEVIGLATWGHSTAETIRFLVPVNVARGYLGRRGVNLAEEGSFTPLFRRGLDEAARGRWRPALRDLRKADALFPGNPDLARLIRDAESAVRALPFWRSPAFGMGLGLLVVIASPLVWTMWRRSHPAARPRPAVAEPHGQPEATVVIPLREARSDGLVGKLTILNGARAGERLGLGGSGIRIGREAAMCEIVLEDPKVSRIHAEIVQLDGRVLLIDRNSSNGTWVNDQKVDRRFLRDGDIIYFGGRNAVAVAFHE